MRLICSGMLFMLMSMTMIQAQHNIELVSRLQYDALLNDIWGYQAEDGTEYALVGLRTGVSIISLANPANPQEAAFVPGPYSIWRDLKTFGDFAYVTTDQSGTKEGLLIIDLSRLPDTVTYTNWKPLIAGRPLEKCHNLYIDDRGIVYLAGCNVNGGGIVMADVATKPGVPELIGPASQEYAHDVYVQNGKMFTSEIYRGELGIYDVSDETQAELLSLTVTPFRFTHNAWVSLDGNTVFTTDERANAPVAAFDISNLGSVRLLDEFRPLASIGQGVIPHNVHVIDSWLAISYYTDGAVIVDASRPDNLIEVGHYDTSPDFDAGFHGAWGAYPFLPSGLLLVADIETGFYVLKPKYLKACHLEGMVREERTGQVLRDVEVNILSDQLNGVVSDAFGRYKTGQAKAGTFTVVFSKAGYRTKEVQVQLKNGILTELDVELAPLRTFSLSGQVLEEAESLTGVAGARLMLEGRDTSYLFTTDQDGVFDFTNVYEGTYTIFAGAWGYRQKVLEDYQLSENQEFKVRLERGYKDDFVLDLGWRSTGNASSGYWVREEPVGTKFDNRLANPDSDIEGDLGRLAYLTGNGGGNAGTDDVDNGKVRLTSPAIDLQDTPFPRLSFHYWFFNSGGEVPIDDTLKFFLANATDTVLLHQETGTTWNQWRKVEFALDTLINTDIPLVLFVETGDLEQSSHIVEAGFDGFRITSDALSTSTSDGDPNPSAILEAFPNPFSEKITLILQPSSIERERQLVIYNSLGQTVFSLSLDAQQRQVEWHPDVPSGMYFVHLFDGNRAVGKWKVIKNN